MCPRSCGNLDSRDRALNTGKVLIVPLFPILLFLALSVPAPAQDWPSYGNDPGGMRYSLLEQINKENVGKLEVAWVHDSGDLSDGTSLPTRSAFETTPLLVDGVLYVVTVFHRLLALDPVSGKQLWEFDPRFDRSQRVNLYHQPRRRLLV